MLDDRFLMTGDYLFLDSIGRPDLQGDAPRFAKELYHSYQSELLTLPEEITILPAHLGPSSPIKMGRPASASLGQVLHRVPIIMADEEEFLTYATAPMLPKPANYNTIMDVNRNFRSLEKGDAEMLEAGPNRCTLPVQVKA
jgi:glyoxylase-like metal-dependent hydrolase (beta-lactamase superfamily II)